MIRSASAHPTEGTTVRPYAPDSTGIDPCWNLTYQFSSAESSPQVADSHALTVYIAVDEYPATPQARRDLVSAYGPYLVQEWRRRRLPLGRELFHLVHAPGDLEASPARRVHRADQAHAQAQESGGVAVALMLANTPLAPHLVVSRFVLA